MDNQGLDRRYASATTQPMFYSSLSSDLLTVYIKLMQHAYHTRMHCLTNFMQAFQIQPPSTYIEKSIIMLPKHSRLQSFIPYPVPALPALHLHASKHQNLYLRTTNSAFAQKYQTTTFSTKKKRKQKKQEHQCLPCLCLCGRIQRAT